MAVHFWPALTVISVTSCLTYRSNSGRPGVASGPRIEQFSESASAVNRTDLATTCGCVRSRCAVEAEPVNADQVLLGEVVEQVADAAADQLQRALGQQPGLDDQLDHPLGEVGGRRWPA